MASLRGEIGIWAPAARYITLHGGVGELGAAVNALQQDVVGVAQGVSTASAQAVEAHDEARQVQGDVTTLGGDTSRAISSLRGELAVAKLEREVLESTVLTLTAAVTALMDHAGLGPAGGITQTSLDQRFKLHDEAANGCLDTICQEMKGGGITVGGVRFSGREAAMDWARIHLLPNTYQCIGGLVYAMCLISEAVVHQEDMMKQEKHGERVKRTFMQSAHVLLVHTVYPPVLDGSKVVQQDSKVDFAELKTNKQWKPVNGEGTCEKLKEGVEQLFELITNTIPLQTNRYFLYAALEELRVLKEFSRVKWRRCEEFGYNMLGFVFENSVSKAVLDARPNPVLKLIGLDEQLKVIRASVDHIQTNLAWSLSIDMGRLPPSLN